MVLFEHAGLLKTLFSFSTDIFSFDFLIQRRTVILNSESLFLQGRCSSSTVRVSIESSVSSDGGTINIGCTKSYFGDHNGVIGCLDGDGRVWLLERNVGSDAEDNVGRGSGGGGGMKRKKRQKRGREDCVKLKSLSVASEGDVFLIEMLAMAGNGSIVAVPREDCRLVGGERDMRDEERGDGTVVIYVFDTMEVFSTWVTERRVDNERRKGVKTLTINCGTPLEGGGRHIRAIQLIAIATSYAVLLSDGSVYTWGDARYPSTLGRDIRVDDRSSTYVDSRADNMPAHIPGHVTALGGLRVRKIVGNGWYMAALTEDNEAYVWGGRPGDDRLIRNLEMSSVIDQKNSKDVGREETVFAKEHSSNDGAEDVHLLQIPSVQDILDIGIGCSHLVVLAHMEDRKEKILGCGMGENGQLGLGKVVSWSEDFVEPAGIRASCVSDGCESALRTDAKKSVAGVWCGEYSTYIALA